MNKLLIFFFLLFISCCINAQNGEAIVNLPQNKHQVDSTLRDIIPKDYYVDEEEDIKVVFTLKIDSLGEVHSAHIRWSVNLQKDKYYTICSNVEKHLNVKFLYYKFVDNKSSRRYAYCDYPYFSSISIR